jgi:hypothetical protein
MFKRLNYFLILTLFLTLNNSAYAYISGTIFGSVQSADSQQPIANAILKTSAGRSAITLSNGEFLIDHEEGQHTLTVMAAGYYSYSTVLNIQAFKTIEINISLVAKVDISSVSPEQILDGENSAIIQAIGITPTDIIEKVEGIVICPENPQIKYHTPINELPVLSFHPVAGTNDYSAAYHNFDTIGHYQIIIQATDIYGNTSLPLTASVIQIIGPDVFEPDDTMEQAKPVVINAREARRHTFHDYGDEDWIKFYGIVGKVYRIEISHLESNSLPEIDFYGPGNTFLFTEPLYDFVIDGESFMEWIVDSEGIYYVCVRNKDPELFGANTGYDLRVGYPEGSFPGLIFGKVTDKDCKPLQDIIIKTSAGRTGISNSMGLFEFDHEVGTYNITFESVFYENKTCSIKVSTIESTEYNLQMKNQKYQLSDAINALQLLSGFHVNSDIFLENTIGLDYVINIMKSLQ